MEIGSGLPDFWSVRRQFRRDRRACSREEPRVSQEVLHEFEDVTQVAHVHTDLIFEHAWCLSCTLENDDARLRRPRLGRDTALPHAIRPVLILGCVHEEHDSGVPKRLFQFLGRCVTEPGALSERVGRLEHRDFLVAPTIQKLPELGRNLPICMLVADENAGLT